MEKYDISVVLGSMNRKNLIKATINSIRNNGFKGNIEIIVIDGGSTDGTCDWLAKQKDIFTIIQPNYKIENDKGYKVKAHSWGEFMNIGFKSCHTDFICMVSDDLILAPGCLQKGYDEMCSRINSGEKVGGGAFYFREYPRQDYFRIIKLPQNFININHGFYYKPALEEIGWLDENSYNFYYGDADIAMRLNLNGWKTIGLQDCFALHLVHLPKVKYNLPRWYIEDINTFTTKYGETLKSDTIVKHDTIVSINAYPFWRNAFINVVSGFILKIHDSKRIGGKFRE